MANNKINPFANPFQAQSVAANQPAAAPQPAPVNNQPPAANTPAANTPAAIAPTTLNQDKTRFDYSVLFRNGIDNNDISAVARMNNAEVFMPSFEQFKEANQDFSSQDQIMVYNDIFQAFNIYEEGGHDESKAFVNNAGLLPYLTVFEELGWPTRKPPELPSVPMSQEFAIGPGAQRNPLRVAHPDQIAESLRHFLNSDNEWERSTVFSRAGNFLTRKSDETEDSPLGHYWAEVGLGNGLLDHNTIRTFVGPRKLNSQGLGSVVNIRGFVGGTAGLTAQALGGIIRTSTVLLSGLVDLSFKREGDGRLERGAMRVANTLTNLGAYVTHQNMSEEDRMFSSRSAFSYNLFTGIGQMFSMIYTSKLGRGMGVSPKLSMHSSLMLGSAMSGAGVQNSILRHGGTEADAAGAFLAFGAVTYGANSLLGANILQRVGLKRASDIATNNALRIAGDASKASSKPISALSQQSKDNINNAIAKSTLDDIGKQIQKAGGLRLKTSNFLESLSEKSINIKGIKLPYGYAASVGLEEFPEETLEEFLHTGMERMFNRNIAIPRAREIVTALGPYEYGTYLDIYGVTHYFKVTHTGERTFLDYNVWKEEQDDLETARGVLRGEFPLDAKFNWDEPIMALLSGFIGGMPLFYISGGHKARQSNDEKMYRQNIALEIARHKPKKREKLLSDIRLELERVQDTTGAFGPNFITPDGSVVDIANAENQAVSVAKKAIDTFMHDLELDIAAYDMFQKDNPSLLQSHRQNKYIYSEAFNIVGWINEVEHALNALQENQPMTYGAQVKEGDTKEVLTARLAGLREKYKEAVMPDPLGDGKHSKLYSKIHLETALLDRLVDVQAEQNVIEQYKKKEKPVDKNYSGFKGDVKREAKRIRADENALYFLGWLRSPDKLKKVLDPHNQNSLYDILDYTYSKLFGGEMTAILNERNELIKQSQQKYTNLDNLLKDFSESVSGYSFIDINKYTDKVDASAWADFTRNTLELQNIIRQGRNISNIAKNNPLLEQQSQQLNNVLNSLLQKMQPVSEEIMPILTYESKRLEGEDLTGLIKPSPDLLAYTKGFNEHLSEAISLGSSPPMFEGQSVIENISDAPSDVLAQIQTEAVSRLMENTFTANLPQGSSPNSLSITNYLSAEVAKLADDGYTIDANSAELLLAELDMMEDLMNVIAEAVRINVGFLQTLPSESRKHSMIKVPRDAHLLLSQKELDMVETMLAENTNRMFAIRNSEKMKSFSRDLEQTRDYVRDLAMRNFFLNQVDVFAKMPGNKNIPQFADAHNNIGTAFGEKKGAEIFDELFAKFQDRTDNAQVIKKEVLEKLREIEKLIIKAEEALSGHLQEFIVHTRKESESQEQYNFIDELNYSTALVKSGPTIRGGLTVDGLHNLSGKGERDSNYKYFMLTNAIMLHRFGQKPSVSERGFTISEVLQAYRDVVKKRNVPKERESNAQAQDIELTGGAWNTATYAQERLVLQMVSFGLNPEVSSLLHQPDAYIELLQKAMYIRGYGGSGKTTQVLLDAYSVLEQITGVKNFITVIVPTEHLKETHIENFIKLGKVEGVDYQIKLKHELIAEHRKKTASLKGIVVVDESSIWGLDTIKTHRSLFEDVVSFWIGDDAQTPSLQSRVAIIDSPIKRYAAERASPITEVFRTGNRQIESMQDYFRLIFNKNFSHNSPTLTYSINPETGIIKGGRYYSTSDEMREEFIKQYELSPIEKRHIGSLIYVVPAIRNRTEMLLWIEEKYGTQKKTELEDYIFTVEYNTGLPDTEGGAPAVGTPNTCVSGLASDRVFFEYNPQKFINDQYRDSDSAPIDLAVNAATYYLVQAGRIGLTGSSRARTFLGIIGDPKRSSPGNVIDGGSRKTNVQFVNDTANQLDRLVYLTDDLTTYKKKEEPPEPPPPPPGPIDRNITITPQNRKEILKSKNFKALKDLLSLENTKRKDKLVNDGDPVIHMSNVVMEVDEVKNTEKKPEHKLDREASRIKNNYFIHAIRFVVTGDTIHQKAAMDSLSRLNSHYKKAYSNNPTKLEAAIIKKPENYFVKTIIELQIPLSSISRDELAITTPTFLSEGISIKNSKGQLEKVNIEGNPAIIRVVGFAKVGKKEVPIIDIEDFVVHTYEESFTGEAGPYTKAKMAAYVLMAKHAGMIVNSITLNHYYPSNATITLLGHETLSDEDIIKAISGVQKVAFLNNEIPVEVTSFLASQQELYQNEALVEHSLYKSGFYYVNQKTNEVVRIAHVGATVDTSGHIVHNIYFNKGDKGAKTHKLTANEFTRDYIPIKETELHFDELRFKKRAEVFNSGTTHNPEIKNAIQGHTLIIPSVINPKGLSPEKVFTHPAMKARNTFLGKIASTRNLTLDKVYNETFNNTSYDSETQTFGADDIKSVFFDVITNQLTDAFLDSIPALIKNTLIEAKIIKSDSTLKKDELKNLFKENRFHIISIDNSPEFRFRTKEDKNNSLGIAMKGYLNAEHGSEIERHEFRLLAKKIEDGFSSEQDIDLRKLLINYNLAKLVQFKEVKVKGSIKTRIADIEIGNISKSEVKREATRLIEELESRGFSVGQVRPSLERKASGKAYFALPVSRPGYPGEVIIELDAAPASIEDINSYIEDLADTWENSDELQAHLAEIKELVSHTDVDRSLTPEELKRLKNASMAAKQIIEASAGYQFLRINQAVLSDILAEIRSQGRQVEVSLEGKKILASGNLFDFHPRFGLDIVGDTAVQKYLNLFAVLSAVRSYAQKTGKVKDKVVTFRQNPFYVKFEQGGAALSVGMDSINPELLETNVQEIKSPEIYTTTDLSGKYLDRAKNMIYNKTEEASDEKGGQHEHEEGDIGDQISDIRVDDNDGLLKLKLFEIGGDSAATFNQAVEVVNDLIGKHADKVLKLRRFEIKNNNDAALFGRMVNGLIELSGYEHNGEWFVEKLSPRHETVHFIMNYMLDPETHQKVLDDIKKSLGKAWIEGDIRHLYEHAAIMFETMSDVAKPKGIFQKFVFGMKWVGARLGLYRWDLHGMLNAVESGYYRNNRVYSSPNYNFDSLEKAVSKDAYDKAKNREDVINRFGHINIYSYVRDYIVGEKFKSYLPFGRSLLKTGGTVDEAIFRTVRFYQNKQDFKDSNGLVVGDRSLQIGDKTYVVNKMTPEEFLIVRRQNTVESKKIVEDYIYYHLSFENVMLHILKEFFPDMNIELAYFTGKDLYNKTKIASRTGNASAASGIHKEAEGQSMKERMSNLLNFALSTVPLYQSINNTIDVNTPKRFIPVSHVEKIFTDTFKRISNVSTDFMQKKLDEALKKGFDSLILTPELLFEEMNHYAQNEITDPYVKNVYESILLEFGDHVIMREQVAHYTHTPYHSRGGNRVLVGMLNIIRNPTEYGGDLDKGESDFTEKVKPMRNLLSAIISHYNSLIIRKIGIVNFANGTFDVRNNQSASIAKINIKDTMDEALVDVNNKVLKDVAKRLNPSDNAHFITVRVDGFDIKDESGSSLLKIRDTSYKKANRTLPSETTQEGEGELEKTITPIYSSKRNIKKFDPPTIKRVLNFLGIYRYSDYMLTQAFDNKHKNGKYSIFNILHSLLMATKVNAELYPAVIDEANLAIEALAANPEIEPYSILDKALLRLTPEAREMYDLIMKRDYGMVDNKLVSRADNTSDAPYHFEQWNEVIHIPSPTDYYVMVEKIASMVSDASMDQVMNTTTAEGELSHTQIPGATINELDAGSEVFIRKKMVQIRPAMTDGTDHPLITDTRVGTQPGNRKTDKDESPFIFNSPFLNMKMGFDESVEFGGIKNDYRGVNYRNNTEKDIQIAILENLFSKEAIRTRSWNRINVLLSPFSDKIKSVVLPVYFFKRGRGKKEVDTLLHIKRSRGEITNVSVNENLLVDNFSDIVAYYDKRFAKSRKKFITALGITEVELNKLIENNEIGVKVDAAKLASVRLALEEHRDYSIKVKEGVTYVAPGNAVDTRNLLFNHGFIKQWNSLSKDTSSQYNLLKAAVKEDFLNWVAALQDSGALSSLLSSTTGVPAVFYSTFQNISITDLTKGRRAHSLIEDVSELQKKEETDGVINPEMIGSVVGLKIEKLRNDWLKNNRYTKEGVKLGKTTEGETEINFEPLTIDELSGMEDIATKNAIFTDMYSDVVLRKQINGVKKDASIITTKYTLKSIQDMSKTAWSPALEAAYMAYLLVNEAVSHLDRQDVTLHKGPAQYIKRGYGIAAPGSLFDLTNEFGVGETSQVLIIDDIPGFNRFFGWEPGDPRGFKLMTDGTSLVNPVWLRLLRNSAGGDAGVVGDFANKTVSYGYDIAADKSFYFKFSQNPIDPTHFRNSKFHQDLMRLMLGEYYHIFDGFLKEHNDFDHAVDLMAAYAVDPKNAVGGVLPRDKMIAYLAHASTVKQGLTNINTYDYTLSENEHPSVDNISVPQKVVTASVPNSALRLQVINTGDGHSSLHSFATQMFSVLGVGEHNSQYVKEFEAALATKSDEFTKQISDVLTKKVKDKESGIERQMNDEELYNAAMVFVKKLISDNSGRSIKGSKLESLLKNPLIKGEVLGNKMFENLASLLNQHIKPKIPGGNYVQQTSLMSIYEDNITGSISIASDLGLDNDSLDISNIDEQGNISNPYMRRKLRPMSYFNNKTNTIYTSKDALVADIASSPSDVRTVPGEVMMSFHYARRFNISSKESLQDVFGLINGLSLYETGLQRVKGLGKNNADEVADIILSAAGGANSTNLSLVNVFKSIESQNRARAIARRIASQNIKDRIQPETTKEDFNKEVKAVLDAPAVVNGIKSQLLVELGHYYYSLNNALDVFAVRIPTTNASAAFMGRIVAFTNTGNSIYTNAEKSILDGSDYDHDELHVFYRGFEESYEQDATPTTEEVNLKVIPSIGATPENRMFNAVTGFYGNPVNHRLTLEPISVENMERFAEEKVSSSSMIAPKIANTISYNMFISGVNFAGVNLVGHFANQFAFTSRLLSQGKEGIAETIRAEMSAVFNEGAYPELISVIANFTNAAVDNSGLNGLLGRLEVNNAVTTLISGMMLYEIGSDEQIQIALEDGTTQTVIVRKQLENKILEMLQEPLVIEAASIVIASASLRNNSPKKRIWEAVDGILKKIKDIDKNAEVRSRLTRILEYAYAGEQLNRLGNIYKIIQEVPGDKAAHTQMLFNIEYAIGQKIEDFLEETVRLKASEVSFKNEDHAIAEATSQIERLKLQGHKFKEGTSSHELFEKEIRSRINIRRIAATNPLILSQLRAIASFKRMDSLLSASSRLSEIRTEVLERIGKPELLYEDSFNDYENSIKKQMVGTFLKNYGETISLNIMDPKDPTKEITLELDMKDDANHMIFLARFSNFIDLLKDKVPDNDFLKRVEFEKSGKNTILHAKFRNSIYIDPAEKAAYVQSFNELNKNFPLAANAIRYYNLMIYGFAFRNGSFSEVTDNALELKFSEKQFDVESEIRNRFKNEATKEEVLKEVLFLSDKILPIVYNAKNAETAKINYYKTIQGSDGAVSMWMKVSEPDAVGKIVNDGGAILVNQIFPKETYAGIPGGYTTYDFTYNKLSKAELFAIRDGEEVTKVTAGYIGITMNPSEAKNASNRPFDTSNIVTIFGDIATVNRIDNNSASFKKLPDKDKPSSSRITVQGSSVSEHTLDILLSVARKAFPSITFSFVDNETSHTNGIAYYHRGIVYINRNKVQVDTFFHELTHPLLHILKEIRPAQYLGLYNDALSLIHNDDPVIGLIRSHYPELHGSDFVDEVISNIVGWVSSDILTERLAIMNDPNYRQNGRTNWERFKNRIKNFWSSIKAFFVGYDISIDPTKTTIRDFAKDIVEKALAGRNVLRITPNDLKNLSRAGYENVWEQKVAPVRTNRELYNLLMNTGTIKQGEDVMSITQYRDLNKEERIQRFIDTIPQRNYVHLTSGGEFLEFNPKKPDTWKDIVEQKVLVETDENYTKIKKRILDSFKKKDFQPSDLQALFGINEHNHKPNVSDISIDKLLRQLRYHKRHKYMLYSELIGTEYEFMYDESLVGFNPIVSIEYDYDDQLIVSLYNITSSSVMHRDKLAPYENANILNRYYSTSHAKRKGIEMNAYLGDASNLLLGVIAGKIQASSKKVYVNQVGTISFNAKDSHMNLMFALDLRANIEAMLASEEFKADMSQEMLAHLNQFITLKDGFDYESVLFNWYGDNAYYKQEVAAFKQGGMNVSDKKKVFLRRLAHLSKKTLDEISSVEAIEIDMLFKAIAMLNGGALSSKQMNSKVDIKNFGKLFSPQFDVGHEMIDVIRRATIQTSQKNVRAMQDFKRDIDGFAEFFRQRYMLRHGSLKEKIKDVTSDYYNELFATVTDRDGIKRFAGSVLWTTDKKLDPLFYKQAQALDPEVLKWGEFIVKIITNQLVENIYHTRLMEFGPTIKKGGDSIPYTREMARMDLFRNTSYKEGMLPLMNDTVGQMLSKGKFSRAARTKAGQIESNYLEFEEIAALSNEDANNLDKMPDMYMEQFANRITEEDIGSLGLTQNRMFKILGLTEHKGEYIYDSVSNRGENINTDVETMLEFFKMSSLRKIGYEANVLPLINSALLYMNDVQNNLEFKQQNAIDYINLFRLQAIEGRRKNLELNIGVNVEPAVMTAMSIASPLVMAGNINVMVVSGIHNFMMAFIEGVGNDIYNAFTPDQKRNWFTSADLAKASGLFFTDFHKITELMREFQLINPNEYEMIVHRFNQKRKQHVFSGFFAQWTNWAADFYARGVIMTAQMLKDGSFYAYTYNEESGRMVYDKRQDRKYFNEDGTQTVEQKILFDALKDRLVTDDIGLDDKGDPLVGYSFDEMRVFKGLADKYIVGAYGPMERNMLTQFLLGRMAMMFTTWFMTKISMALKEGSYLDEVGYYAIVKDSHGNLVPQWQREWTEGYMRTIARMSTDLVLKGNISQFKQMKPHERYNWIKGVLTLTLFLFSYGLYGLAASEDEDPEERKDVFLGVEYTRFYETRLRKNWAFAAGSLLVIPTIADKLTSPFAVVGILGRAFRQGLQITEGNWENLRFVVPYLGGIFTIRDEYNALSGPE